MVNAPVVAKERGIKVSETRRDQQGIYEGYIKITVTLADGSTRRVAGTVFSDGRPRLIQIKDINLDAEFAPHMLYVINEDKPGFIGKLGTLLGDAKVNIAYFTLGRSAPGRGRHRAGRSRRRGRRERAGRHPQAAAGEAGQGACILTGCRFTSFASPRRGGTSMSTGSRDRSRLGCVGGVLVGRGVWANTHRGSSRTSGSATPLPRRSRSAARPAVRRSIAARFAAAQLWHV